MHIHFEHRSKSLNWNCFCIELHHSCLVELMSLGSVLKLQLFFGRLNHIFRLQKTRNHEFSIPILKTEIFFCIIKLPKKKNGNFPWNLQVFLSPQGNTKPGSLYFFQNHLWNLPSTLSSRSSSRSRSSSKSKCQALFSLQV